MTDNDKLYFTEQVKIILQNAGTNQLNLSSEAARDVLVEELIPVVKNILQNYTKQ